MAQVTIKEVAREAGVSTAVVSYVLRGVSRSTYRPETINRVHIAAQRLGYEANGVARMLRQKTTNMIGLAIDIRHSYLNPVVLAAHKEIVRCGYVPVLIEPRGDNTYSPSLAMGMLAGVISVDSRMMHDVPEFYESLRQRLPVVALYPLRAKNIDYVATDRARAIDIAAEHLVSLRHKRIAFAMPFLAKSLVDRLKAKGWQKAQKKYALEAIPEYNIDVGGVNVVQAGSMIAEAIMLMRRKPTAVICASDEWALSTAGELMRAGWKVPQQISIVGYGNTACDTYVFPRITAVCPPVDEIARMAVERIMHRIETQSSDAPLKPLQKLLTPHLAVRESTAPRS